MIALSPPFRLATAGDAPVLAELVFIASEGLVADIWAGLAEKGQDPWEVGRKRQAAKAEAGQIVVVDEGNGAIAALTGYIIPEHPGPIPANIPPLFRDLQELENKAPASWYVNVLATLPAHRGRGLGSLLLAVADDIARENGLDRVSLIVADTNVAARRLYERVGYRETGRRPLSSGDWTTDIGEWVLMIK